MHYVKTPAGMLPVPDPGDELRFHEFGIEFQPDRIAARFYWMTDDDYWKDEGNYGNGLGIVHSHKLTGTFSETCVRWPRFTVLVVRERELYSRWADSIL